MPTNEERKEIAKWLRSLADTGGYSHRDDRLLGEILGSVHLKRGNIDEVLRLFADLIEPEPVRSCLVKNDEHGTPRCGECECVVYDEYIDAIVNYCPSCGCCVKEEPDAAE